MFTYKTVETIAVNFDNELRRKVYITPKSYLDSISMYKKHLDKKRLELNETIDRLSNGLKKLSATNIQVAELKTMLTKMEPELKEEKQNASTKAVAIGNESKIAGEKEKLVEEEEKVVGAQAMEIKAVKDEVEKQLDEAKPIMEKAQAALLVLNDDHLFEVKKMNNPNKAVIMTMEAVLIYLRAPKLDWPTARQYMSDKNFKDKLKNYDVDTIPESILKKVRKIIYKKEFVPEEIGQKAKAAECLSRWALALEKYAVIRQKIIPIERQLAEMNEKFSVAQGKLDLKSAELKKVKDYVRQLQNDYDETLNKIDELNENIKLNKLKLERAVKLIDLTKEEGENWTNTVSNLRENMIQLVGDIFLATASISYIGPFTGIYRDKIIKPLEKKLAELKIPFSESYKLRTTLGNPVEIRDWNINGLPSDTVSIDNGIMSVKSDRWPLMIDPQTQANQWIKKSYPEDLKVVKLSETVRYQKIVDSALQLGHIVLIQDVQEEIDPSLDNILQKAIFINNGLPCINF